jgi:tRNA1Val (adenine37-N6)-methyltransferase
MNPNLKENERLDSLQRNGYQIIQNPEKFCFGMDAVLLSGFARAKEGDRVLDMGTGTGIIPILMEAKTPAAELIGLEIQPESADMASRSVLHNHLEKQVEIVNGDIKEAACIFGSASFDVITTNPPYMIGQHGIANVSDTKAIARHEVLCTLDDILRESAKTGWTRIGSSTSYQMTAVFSAEKNPKSFGRECVMPTRTVWNSSAAENCR